jgi:hypothetical protein
MDMSPGGGRACLTAVNWSTVVKMGAFETLVAIVLPKRGPAARKNGCSNEWSSSKKKLSMEIVLIEMLHLFF